MQTITITLADNELHRLKATAAELGLAVEDVIQKSIEEYLDRRRRVDEAASYVLTKNEELYRRLAR